MEIYLAVAISRKFSFHLSLALNAGKTLKKANGFGYFSPNRFGHLPKPFWAIFWPKIRDILSLQINVMLSFTEKIIFIGKVLARRKIIIKNKWYKPFLSKSRINDLFYS